MGVCLIIRSGGGTDTSNATATAARILSGYTCYVNDTKITGTMTNRGTVNQSLNPGGSYTIPAGYHSGSGKVTVTSLSANTSGTANASRILSGYTGWVGGSKLTGTMTNRGAVSQTLSANGSYTIPSGWHNGSGKVTQSLTTQGAKSVTPSTSNQTACSANRWTTGTITIVGSSSLVAGNIKNGVTIFGVKGTFRGVVDSTLWLVQDKVAKVGGVYARWESYGSAWSNVSRFHVDLPWDDTAYNALSEYGWLHYNVVSDWGIWFFYLDYFSYNGDLQSDNRKTIRSGSSSNSSSNRSFSGSTTIDWGTNWKRLRYIVFDIGNGSKDWFTDVDIWLT